MENIHKLKFISKSFFSSWLIWSLIPSGLLGYFFYTSLVNQIEDLKKDSGFKNVSDKVFYQLDLFNLLLSAWILSAGTGHLASQFHSRDLLILPKRKLGVFLCSILYFLLNFLYLIGEAGVSFYIGLVSMVFSWIQVTSSIWVVNVFTSTFVERCKQLAAVSNHNAMIEESTLIVTQYGNLEKGLGPILLFQFSSNLITITAYFYWFTFYYEWKCWLAIAEGIMMIWNLTLSNQDCFEALQDTSEVLR